MPALLTSTAMLKCPHQGTVTIIPKQFQVLAGGAPILRAVDLVGSPILGCLQAPSPTTKPCTTILSVAPGSFSTAVTVLGLPALLVTVKGVTDGVPPGMVTVFLAGQFSVNG